MERRYRSYTNTDRRYNDVSITEFKFYNKRRGFINNEVLDSLVKKAKETQQPVYWTNEYFTKHRMGFMLYYKNQEAKIGFIKASGDFTVNDFNVSKVIYNNNIFIHFDLDKEQHDILEKYYIPTELKKEGKIFICKGWKDTVDTLIVSKVLLNRRNSYDMNTKDNVKALFPDIKVDWVEYENTLEGYRGPNYLGHIIEVVERRINDKNYRVAVCAIFEGSSTEKFKFHIFDEDDENYNYIDKDRLFIKIEQGNNKSIYYFVDTTINRYRQAKNKSYLILNLDTFKFIARDVEQVLGKQKIINPQIYRFYDERVVSFENYNYEDKLSDEEKILLGRYKEILIANRKLKIDKMIVTNTSLALENESFSMKFDKGFLDIMEHIWSIRELVKKEDIVYNINQFYEAILKISALRVISHKYVRIDTYKDFKNTKFTLNNMPIEVKKIGNRIYINDVFCRIHDIFHILTKAICYNDINEFNLYVKEVSYIGVKWKVLISNGISLEVKNPFFDMFTEIGLKEVDKLYLRFSLLWSINNRRKIFLLLNGKEYLIKNKIKFIKHFGFPKQELSMGSLKSHLNDSLENLDDNTFIEIIENGMEEAKIIKERGEELVRETIKDINAEATEIEIGGRKVKGYIVNGIQTKSKYFINKMSLDVYKFKDGKWNRRCVVDDHRKQRIFEDRLANRLVNIRNEPKKIYTLFNI